MEYETTLQVREWQLAKEFRRRIRPGTLVWQNDLKESFGITVKGERVYANLYAQGVKVVGVDGNRDQWAVWGYQSVIKMAREEIKEHGLQKLKVSLQGLF